MRRPILTAAAPACLLLGLTPVSAAADVAPPGAATATAARVSDLVQVSRSAATADQAKSEAKADVISIGGTTIPGTGGSRSEEGESGGALIDTGPGQAPQVQVAPWKAKSSGANSDKRSSSAEAAVARVDVPARAAPGAGDGQEAAASGEISVGVLTSKADAEHTPTQSSGTSTSDAADIQIGDTLHLVLLHSEVTSNARGNSYLASINGTKIGTQEQLNELCSLDAGVAALSCLTASGGAAHGITTGTAEVLGVQTSLGLPASAFATTGTMATGSAPSILESVAAAVPVAEVPRAAAAPVAEPALPRTGVAAASLAASGMAGLLTGLILRLLGRRRSGAIA
ncbi:MAG TPA: hypothetical protein VEG38_20660 [Acidimicrobiia bacterium]|nr:hypothetical protein [Acidimicrobiia bacterium]